MANWNIMHVFGYGESQMLGADKNGKAKNVELAAIGPLITYLATQEQQGTTISMETLHALNMYKDQFVDFVPNSENNGWQRFAMADIDTSHIENPRSSGCSEGHPEEQIKSRSLNGLHQAPAQ